MTPRKNYKQEYRSISKDLLIKRHPEQQPNNYDLANNHYETFHFYYQADKQIVKMLIPHHHLFVGDGRRVLEDDPLHSLAAGRRGQGAVVDEVFLRGVRQETSQGEG